LKKKNEKRQNKAPDPESDPIFKKFSITRKMIEDFKIEFEISMEG